MNPYQKKHELIVKNQTEVFQSKMIAKQSKFIIKYQISTMNQNHGNTNTLL